MFTELHFVQKGESMPISESRAVMVRSVKSRITLCSDHQCETKECGCDSGVCPAATGE